MLQLSVQNGGKPLEEKVFLIRCRGVRVLKTSEAASLLNVSPNTLRAWERRFGYPKPQRSPGKHRLYTHGEIAALKAALQEGLSISSAVSRAREGLSADADTLVAAVTSFSQDQADRAMESVLALRPLDRAIEEVLLPSLDEVARRLGPESAAWAFASSWGSEWLRRVQRLGLSPARRVGVLLGDASNGVLDPDTHYIRAFELLTVRAGVRLLSMPVTGVQGLGEAIAIFRPTALVVAGARAEDDQVAKWAYAVRASTGALPVALYRRDISRPERLRTTGAQMLSASPIAAHRQLVDSLENEYVTARGPHLAGRAVSA